MIEWILGIKCSFHLWLGKKDFWSAHKHLDKSGAMVNLVVKNNNGGAISVHTSFPNVVEAVEKAIESTAGKEGGTEC